MFDSAADTSLFGMAGLPDASPSTRSRRMWVTAIAVLSLAVLGLGAGIAYSLNSARAWQDTASRSATELRIARGQLDDVQARLVVLSDRVTMELDTCVRDLQTLSTNLVAYQGEDMTSLLDLAGQADTDCTLARSDNAVLAQRLAAR